MTSIWVDSRKRVAGNDADFEFDIGQTVHLQGSARLSVFKIRVADTFLSTDRGTYMYWRDQALNGLNWAQLPVGAYTGARLAAWISSNYASATYVESTNEITVAHDGNRTILNDQELRNLFPGSGSYPQGATPSAPQSINHLLGPSFIADGSQVFTFFVWGFSKEDKPRGPRRGAVRAKPLNCTRSTSHSTAHDNMKRLTRFQRSGHASSSYFESSKGFWTHTCSLERGPDARRV